MVLLLAASQVTFSVARDGLLPQIFGTIHPKFRTLHLTTIVVGLFAGLITVVPLQTLAEIAAVATLAIFVFVCAAVLWLRHSSPDVHRAFRVWSPIIPLVGVVAGVVLIASTPLATLLRLAVWVVMGFILYVAYG
jgi:APA family basic amino acid/polyamine antiporter